MFTSFTLIVSLSTQHAVILDWSLSWSWLQMLKCGYGNSCQVVMDADWMPQFQCKVELPYHVHEISRCQPTIKVQQENIRLSSKDRQWMKLVFKESKEVYLHPPYVFCVIFQSIHSMFSGTCKFTFFRQINYSHAAKLMVIAFMWYIKCDHCGRMCSTSVS